MNLLNFLWLDLICLAIICVLVNGSLTGNFYTHGRSGRRKQIASIKSHPLRLVSLFLAIALSVWAIIDLRHKFALLQFLPR